MGQRNSLLSDKNMLSFFVKSATIYMVFTKVPDADLLREGLRSLSFYLNKDSIMVYGWTIKRSGDGQDKKS